MAIIPSTGRGVLVSILFLITILTSCNTIPDTPPEDPADLLQEDSAYEVIRIDSPGEHGGTWYSLAYLSQNYLSPMFENLDWTIQELGGGYTEEDLTSGLVTLQSKAYSSFDAEFSSKDIVLLDSSGLVLCRKQIRFRLPDYHELSSRRVYYRKEELIVPPGTTVPFSIQLAERDNSIIYAEWDIGKIQ